MIAIVNTDLNWGIGYQGRLQISISADLRRFKSMTIGKVIIYGAKTLATYPGQKALPGRKNLILSRQGQLRVDNAEICSSLDVLKQKVEEYKALYSFQDSDFVVVGGASVYESLLDDCSDVYLTRTYADLPADSYFPNLDLKENWELIDCSEKMLDDKSGLAYAYLHYQRHSD